MPIILNAANEVAVELFMKNKISFLNIYEIISTTLNYAYKSNVHLTSVSLESILEFNREAKKISDEQKIEIKYFNIIYEAIEYIEKRLSGLLEPDTKEISLGSAEVQKIFKVSKFGKIAGSKVIEGEIHNKSKARIVRDGSVVYEGEIISIFREKNAVKEVKNGLECGISFKDFIDFKEKDIIESYQIEKIERTI